MLLQLGFLLSEKFASSSIKAPYPEVFKLPNVCHLSKKTNTVIVEEATTNSGAVRPNHREMLDWRRR